MGETVFRVQDKKGRGPWKPGFSHVWVEDRDDHDNLVPWFVEFGRVDQKALYGANLGSATRTLEQLQRWFTPSEYAHLQLLGYHAVRMEADRILAESDIQCVFERVIPLNEAVETIELYAKSEAA